MKVIIRADASFEIGSGHIMRCLVLADVLVARGAQVHFICRSHPGHHGAQIAARGHGVTLLPRGAEGEIDSLGTAHANWLGTDQATDATETLGILAEHGLANLLIVDHYALDRTFERALRPAVERIAVIDDLADRPHDCDVLLDQNHGRLAADYAGLVPDTATLCIGPSWAILRPEFAEHRAASLGRRAGTDLRTILVSMGGGDVLGLTSRALDALSNCRLPPSLSIRVVLGRLHRNHHAIMVQAANMPVLTHVLVDIADMAAEMAAADLGIGAGGTTSWERCCLGLPALVAPLAENQRAIIRALAEVGAVWAVESDEGFEAAVEHQVLRCLGKPSLLAEMSARAAVLCDGRGTNRFIDEIIPKEISK